MKKLPSIYANSIEKNKDNNDSIYKSYKNEKNKTEETTEKQENKTKYPQKTINQKIRELMNSKNHSYKIPVKIKTKENVLEKEIIGKNSKNLITIENELIKIEDIIEIEKNE